MIKTLYTLTTYIHTYPGSTYIYNGLFVISCMNLIAMLWSPLNGVLGLIPGHEQAFADTL